MGLWISTKTYSFKEGLTCCYRRWNATDKTNKIHGTSLAFKLVFECHNLDDQGRIIDFPQLDHISSWLRDNFAYTTCISQDDPELDLFKALHDKGIIDLRIVFGTGPERFAEMLFREIMSWLKDSQTISRVTIRSVECLVHDADSALYVE